MKITKLIAQSAVISFAAVFLLTGTSCSTSSGGGQTLISAVWKKPFLSVWDTAIMFSETI